MPSKPSGGNLPVLSLPAGPTSDTPAPQPSPQPSPPSGERGSKDKESSDKLEVKEKKEKGSLHYSKPR